MMGNPLVGPVFLAPNGSERNGLFFFFLTKTAMLIKFEFENVIGEKIFWIVVCKDEPEVTGEKTLL